MRYARRGPFALRPGFVERRRASLPVSVVPVLVAVAIVGYVIGHAAGGGSVQHGRAARAVNALIEYPSGWRHVAAPSPVPGLTLTRASLIAPGGDPSAAGLLVGSLPNDEASPLPAAFLERVRRQPQTTIVNLLEAQAYRYAQLSVRGFAKALTVFVVPDAPGQAIALACYAPASASPQMAACEQAIATVTIAGQLQTFPLLPESEYASAISAAVTKLDRLRAASARGLEPHAGARGAERLARRLAAAYATAHATLSRLEPNPAAQRAQSALEGAIAEAQGGYEALADAAAEGSEAGYTAARARVAAAETAVDRALENYVLLGYGTSTG